MIPNQNPEQLARDKIDQMLTASGWIVQSKKELNLDTKNLGEQAEQEFMAFVPNDDNRKFTELYAVTRLKSSFIPDDSQVYISHHSAYVFHFTRQRNG